MLYSKPPEYSFLKTFGCLCWPNLRPYNRHKTDYRSLPCVFLGYSTSHHGYLCYHLLTSRLYISRDVIFDESQFPFATPPLNTTPPQHLPPQPYITSSFSLPPQQIRPPPITPSSPSSDSPIQSHSPSSNTESPSPPAIPPSHIQTRSHSNLHFPKIFRDGTIPWPPPRASLTTLPIPTEPSNYTEAAKHPAWRQAMQHEFDALLSTKTWSLVPPSTAYNVVGCKWIFKSKYLPDGSLHRRKARLVAKGYHQLSGVDYTETFSPVVKPATIRLILSLAISANWSLHQFDVQNAFLHGSLNEPVYMEQPLGFTHPHFPHYVCKLHRALYGLKQAPRAWYARLSRKLQELGFTMSKSDTSLFIYKHNSVTLYFLAYVDDIIFTGSDDSTIQLVLSQLTAEFPITNLGRLHYFFGIECSHIAGGLVLSQCKYIHDLLSKTNMLNCKPVTSPMATSTKLTAVDSSPMDDATLYCSTVGSLQYLLFTIPDLAFSVDRVCQFMHDPRRSHWQTVK